MNPLNISVLGFQTFPTGKTTYDEQQYITSFFLIGDYLISEEFSITTNYGQEFLRSSANRKQFFLLKTELPLFFSDSDLEYYFSIGYVWQNYLGESDHKLNLGYRVNFFYDFQIDLNLLLLLNEESGSVGLGVAKSF